MSFFLSGLPVAPPLLSSVKLIRCCNRLLVSRPSSRSPRGWSRIRSGLPRTLRRWRQSASRLPRILRGASKGARGFIQLRILRSRPLPRKILLHAVQLDALPDSLVHVMMQRLPHRIQQRFTSVLLELEPRPCSVFHVERLDAVVQPPGGSHNRPPTLLQPHHLIHPATLIPPP